MQTEQVQKAASQGIKAEQQTTQIVSVAVTAIPTLNQLGEPAALAKLRETLQPNLELCRTVEVKDEKGKAICNALIGAVKPLGQKLDEARRAINRACKETIDGRFMPIIREIQDAIAGADAQRRAYDTQQMEIARQKQREAEEKARQEQAELERRRKLQQAAIDRGGQARQEIPETAPVEVVNVPAVIAENSRQHYRLAYEVTDVNALPDGYYIRVPKAKEIQTVMLEVEKTYEKERRGIDDPDQPLAGVRFFWQAVYRDR